MANFATPYKDIVGRMLKGERSGHYEMRPGRGMELSDIRNVPPEVATKVRAVWSEIAAGKPVPEISGSGGRRELVPIGAQPRRNRRHRAGDRSRPILGFSRP